VNLNQVTLPSSNIERSIEFYTKLGLRLIVQKLPRYARFELPEGHSSLSVELTEHITKSRTVIYFECSALDSTVDALQEQGVNFTALPVDQPWLWREAYLEDPDGNTLCLFHAGSNRLNPPWRIA